MSDYYSHKDRHRTGTPDYYDNVGSGGATWLWVGILLFALVALLAAVFSGGGTGDGTETGPAAIEAPPPADGAPVVID